MSGEPSQIPAQSLLDGGRFEFEQAAVGRNVLTRQTRLMEDLFLAVALHESGMVESAVNRREQAVGCVQIRSCVVADVNEYLSSIEVEQRFTLDNAKFIDESYQMFCLYLYRWAPGKSFEYMARVWTGGPSGWHKASTVTYWKAVQQRLQDVHSAREIRERARSRVLHSVEADSAARLVEEWRCQDLSGSIHELKSIIKGRKRK